MGQIYHVALQTSKKKSLEVEKFIKEQGSSNPENYKPLKRMELHDGSVIFEWRMEWSPFIFKEDRALMEILESGDAQDFDGNMSEDDYFDQAYKLIALGDEGSVDCRYNNAGEEWFEELYVHQEIEFPDEYKTDKAEVVKLKEENELLKSILEEALAEIIDSTYPEYRADLLDSIGATHENLEKLGFHTIR